MKMSYVKRIAFNAGRKHIFFCNVSQFDLLCFLTPFVVRVPSVSTPVMFTFESFRDRGFRGFSQYFQRNMYTAF
jgi:hypothetical protein